MSLAQESSASSWLTTLPTKECGFALHKEANWDALALRYGWCPVIGLYIAQVYGKYPLEL